MKKLTKLIALASVVGTSVAAQADVTTTSLADMKGLRGDVISVIATLKDGSTPLSGQTIPFRWKSDARGWTSLPSAVTNGTGKATISFTIPTSPSDDNVIVEARFAGQSGPGIPYTASYVERRVRIGTRVK
jgi:hypothetical protein